MTTLLSTYAQNNLENAILELLVDRLANGLLGETIPYNLYHIQTGEMIVPAGRKITRTLLRRMAEKRAFLEIAPGPIRNWIFKTISEWNESKYEEIRKALDEMEGAV